MYYIDRQTGRVQKRQQQPQVNPLTILKHFQQGSGQTPGIGESDSSIFSNIGDLFSSGGESGGSSGWGTAGWIAAIIALQEILSNNTSTVFEGQETGDVFDLNFMTEPWLGFAWDKLGFEPSSGEKFDAAVKNSDWGTALKRLPAAANYWAHPEGQLGYELTSNILGEDVAKILNPIEWLINNISDIF